MNQRKDSRIPKGFLINEGLVEVDQSEMETSEDELISTLLFSISEAAKYLGIGKKELYRLIEWGEVKAVKSGDSLLVDRSSLDAFKGSQKSTFL
jgi:excisionase family DNA binding protein